MGKMLKKLSLKGISINKCIQGVSIEPIKKILFACIEGKRPAYASAFRKNPA
jgi:hypothetical protein